MFTDLIASLDALERLTAPPLTTAMAVARLKQYLPDPVRRIDLHDLVMGAADELAAQIAQPVRNPDLTWEHLQTLWQQHLADTSTLATLVSVGVWHDQEGTHDQLWLDVLTRLVTASRDNETTTHQRLTAARLWPALLIFASAGVAATQRGRESLLIKMATSVQRERLNSTRTTAIELLHPEYLVPKDVVPKAPKGQRWLYPDSHQLLTALRSLFDTLIPDDDEFTRAFHGWEYRLSLILSRLGKPDRPARLYSGEYLLPFDWADREPPETQTEFGQSANSDPQSIWLEYLGTEDLDEYLQEHAQNLRPYISHGF